MAVIKVHGNPISTNTMRVLACLYEKQVEFDFVPVDLAAGEHKTESFLSLNPFGQVPVVEDGDLKLFQSRAITGHIAHSNFNNGTPLVYRDDKKMAIVGLWMEVEAHQFDPSASKLNWELYYKPLFGMETDGDAVEKYEAELAKVLDIYEVRLTESKYLAGESFSLADLHHMPDLHYLMKGSAKKLLESRPHVNAWCIDILARPAWSKVTAM